MRAAPVVVAAAKARLVAGGQFLSRGGAGALGILPAVDGNAIARAHDGAEQRVFKERALGQKGDGLVALHSRHERVHERIGVVATQHEGAWQAQALAVAHFEAPKKHAQPEAHHRLHDGVEKHRLASLHQKRPTTYAAGLFCTC
uniref:Uncharacterized protein n=1 Tax=Tanacetum cinerariifolium TaxID=118510 RepID=A0A699TEU6_TANCI|nr:hypothetical protein [Tanacetum cinerariifolium]